MQVEALPAPGGVLRRREERVLCWVEPLGGTIFSPSGRGVLGGALTPHFQAVPGRGRGGAWAVEKGLRSEKPQPRPQRLSAVTFLLGALSLSASFSFSG